MTTHCGKNPFLVQKHIIYKSLIFFVFDNCFFSAVRLLFISCLFTFVSYLFTFLTAVWLHTYFSTICLLHQPFVYFFQLFVYIYQLFVYIFVMLSRILEFWRKNFICVEKFKERKKEIFLVVKIQIEFLNKKYFFTTVCND